MNRTTLVYLISALLLLGGGAAIFLVKNLRVSTDKETTQPDRIESSQRSLVEILTQTEEFVKEGQTDQAKDALNAFDENLSEFVLLLSDRKHIEKSIVEGGDEIKRIRKAEWDLYRAFYEKKEIFDLNPELAARGKIIENQISEKLRGSMLSAAEVMRLEYWKEVSQQREESWSPVPSVFAAGQPSSKVIYIARRIDPSDPGTQGGLIQNCWRYESWAELSTVSIREQNQVNFGDVRENNCKVEIDITNGVSGEKLALDPVQKRAEWIDSRKGKFGISGRGTVNNLNPFEDFQQKLQSEEYKLEGTEVIGGEEVYVLRRTDYGLDFTRIYVNAATYLPIRETSYAEVIEIKRAEEDYFPGGLHPEGAVPAEVIHTGNIEKSMNVIIEGKFIERRELPQDFFETKVPDGYRPEDFVPFG